MSTNRFMTTVMCDDVRREEGNKLSYMGIYGANLVVKNFPHTLPKLCFVMSVLCPGDEDPPKSLTFRLLNDDETIAELVLPEAALERTRTAALADDGRDSKRIVLGTVIQLFPFQLAGPCTLKARALCDGEELKGGSWPIVKAT